MSLRKRDERGDAVELVVLAPALLVVLLLVVGLARMAHASQQVEAGAADAARAASLERNTSASENAAKKAATDSLGSMGLSCSSMSVNVDISQYKPGGTVKVTLKCVASLGDVAMAGFPGTKTFKSTSIVPIENYRAE